MTPKQKPPTPARRAPRKPPATLSREWLDLVERSATAGSWSWDVKTHTFHWSGGMFALFGLDPAKDQPGFETWLQCLHPEDRVASQHRVEQAMLQRTPMIIQYRIVRPDGQIRWIDGFGDTVFDAHGQAERMSGFCMDSTLRMTLEKDKAALETQLAETRKLKAELRHSNHQMELVLHASGQGLFALDLQEGKAQFDMRISKLLGFKSHGLNLTIQQWTQRIHPDDLVRVQGELDAHLLGKTGSYQAELRVKHRDGHWMWLLCSGQRIAQGEADGSTQVIGTLQDISQFKRLSDESTQLLGKLESLLAQASSPRLQIPALPLDAEMDAKQTLSRRQQQTIVMIAKGMNSQAIAQALGITTSTAISHRRALMKKLNLHNASEVTRFAIRNRLIEG